MCDFMCSGLDRPVLLLYTSPPSRRLLAFQPKHTGLFPHVTLVGGRKKSDRFGPIKE